MNRHPRLTLAACGFIGGILAAPVLVAVLYFVEQHEVRKMGSRAKAIRAAELDAAMRRHPSGRAA